MLIKNLKLKNFRNHLDLEIDFYDDLNLIIGPNGSGKTNILEAIYCLSTAKSPRTKYDKDLINHNGKYCTIESMVLADSDEYRLLLWVTKKDDSTNISTKKALINSTPKSIQYFTGLFNAVLFTPQDIEIIIDSPAKKRRYMDFVITQVDKDYKRNLTDYKKAVKRRNKVLESIRDFNKGRNQLTYWDKKISETGHQVQNVRTKFIKYLNTRVDKYINELNGKETKLKILYKKNEITKERLKEYHSIEVGAKTTLLGPHRDKFNINFDEYDIAEFGSRGQQRTTLLGLKLSELDYIEKEKGERPVLLLDDIFSELDENHKRAVLETIKKQQTIITSTEKYDFIKDCKTIHLNS